MDICVGFGYWIIYRSEIYSDYLHFCLEDSKMLDALKYLFWRDSTKFCTNSRILEMCQLACLLETLIYGIAQVSVGSVLFFQFS